MSEHNIFSKENIKNYIKSLNNGIKKKNIEDGVDQNTYEQIWQEMGSKEVATLYLTILTGALNFVENKFNDNSDEIEKNLDFTVEQVNFKNQKRLLKKGILENKNMTKIIL
jgi:hypothetical protein